MIVEALLLCALSVLASVLVAAWRSPVLGRMALRNVRRDPRRTATVLIGLMLGTAILSGSFVTGDSTTYGIRKSTLEAFGEVDETVGVEGDLYFPEWVHEEIASHRAVRESLEGVSPLVLQDAAVAHRGANLWEPRAILVGYDPERSGALGGFLDGRGQLRSDRLEPGQAILNEPLASTLQAKSGDRVQVRYSVRPDPLLPELLQKNGTLTLSSGAYPNYFHSTLDDFELEFDVGTGARLVTGVLTWQAPATDLDLELSPPGSASIWNANGSVGAPDAPAILNATAVEGSWTARVHGKDAVNVAFQLRILVFYEVYDLARLERFLEEVQNQTEGRAEAELSRILNPEIREHNLTVAFVARNERRGSFLGTPNVFLRLDELQGLLGKQDRINLIAASNPGDVETGLARTEDAMRALGAALLDLRAAHPDEPVSGALDARDLKRYWVNQAQQAGSLFSNFLTMMGSFSILSGLMLVVNIFFMLAEERQSELGIARALGLRRRDLAKLFTFEGAIYAVAGSGVGALLGLALAFGLLQGFNSAFSERIELVIPFHPEPQSLLFASAAGILMTVGAVLVASHRASRLHIVGAIRRLEPPAASAGQVVVVVGWALFAAGAAASVVGFLWSVFALELLGPCAAILGAAVAGRRFAHRATVAKLAGSGLLLYAFWTILAVETPNTTEAMILGPVRAFLMVIGAVLVIVHSDHLILWSGRILSRARSLRPAARAAIAYPLQKKLRTGLTVVMFALVITVVVLFSIFFAIFTPNLADQAGSYDIRASSTLPVDDLGSYASTRDPRLLSGVSALDNLVVAEVWGGELVRIDGNPVRHRGPPRDFVYGFDSDFAAHSDLPMLELDPRFATAREAYEAALSDPSLAIVSQAYAFGEAGEPGTYHVGARLTMKTRDGASNFTIVGIQKQVYFEGVWLSKTLVQARFDNVRGQYLLQLASGVDADAVAQRLESALQEIGLDAKSVEAEAQQLLEATRRLYSLFELYLGLGLVVGIASLGIVTARSVLERRQEIGMLRAIGFSRKLVFRSFLIEVLFTATLGIAVGLAVGIAVAWGVHWTILRDLGYPFSIPVFDLLLILVVAYGATILCTLWPARRAARLPAAEAIRYIE